MFSFQEVLFSKECSARKSIDRIGEAEQQTQPVRCLYPERERERETDRQTDTQTKCGDTQKYRPSQ